eukprot:TRINITY_DN16118_c0_g1_i1.p1 TRINITY_DN16118_c0_g1~~TRINITY_DN16118_c0_g1_i1.p1  ORF type:complete len:499 (+),score=91.54 TRINITY_DN16118_c0_g1_i1:82-1578(+)
MLPEELPPLPSLSASPPCGPATAAVRARQQVAYERWILRVAFCLGVASCMLGFAAHTRWRSQQRLRLAEQRAARAESELARVQAELLSHPTPRPAAPEAAHAALGAPPVPPPPAAPPPGDPPPPPHAAPRPAALRPPPPALAPAGSAGCAESGAVLAALRSAAAVLLGPAALAAGLTRAAQGASTELTMLSIGAHDGNYSDTNDPLQRQYMRPASPWRGAAVEMLPLLYETLRDAIRSAGADGRVLALNALALRGPSRPVTAFYMDPEWAAANPGAHPLQWSRTDALSIHRLAQQHDATAFLRERSVRSANLSDIAQRWRGSAQCWASRCCGQLHWLAVDAEGADDEILLSALDDAGLRPAVVTTESGTAPELLRQRGYAVWTRMGRVAPRCQSAWSRLGGKALDPRCMQWEDWLGVRRDLLPRDPTDPPPQPPPRDVAFAAGRHPRWGALFPKFPGWIESCCDLCASGQFCSDASQRCYGTRRKPDYRNCTEGSEIP